MKLRRPAPHPSVSLHWKTRAEQLAQQAFQRYLADPEELWLDAPHWLRIVETDDLHAREYQMQYLQWLVGDKYYYIDAWFSPQSWIDENDGEWDGAPEEDANPNEFIGFTLTDFKYFEPQLTKQGLYDIWKEYLDKYQQKMGIIASPPPN